MIARPLLAGLGSALCLVALSCGTNGGDDIDSGTDALVSGGAPTSTGGDPSSGGDPPDDGDGGLGGSMSGGRASGGHASGGDGTDCHAEGDGRTTLALVNHCTGTLEYAGSDIAGGTLETGQVGCADIGSDVESLSAKRYWGWIGENPGAEHHSLAEFTFNTDFYDFDWYNISHVDAFNLPLQIVPIARPDCDALTCAEDLLPSCPAIGVQEDASGVAISCVSPDRDNPDSPVALYFEQCDEGYAWSGDDQQGEDPSPVKACAGEDWDIVFCPER